MVHTVCLNNGIYWCFQNPLDDEPGQSVIPLIPEKAPVYILDEECAAVGDPINAALASTIELRGKQKMTPENASVKRKKYETVHVLSPTKINPELYRTLPPYAKSND